MSDNYCSQGAVSPRLWQHARSRLASIQPGGYNYAHSDLGYSERRGGFNLDKLPGIF